MWSSAQAYETVNEDFNNLDIHNNLRLTRFVSFSFHINVDTKYLQYQ